MQYNKIIKIVNIGLEISIEYKLAQRGSEGRAPSLSRKPPAATETITVHYNSKPYRCLQDRLHAALTGLYRSDNLMSDML